MLLKPAERLHVFFKTRSSFSMENLSGILKEWKYLVEGLDKCFSKIWSLFFYTNVSISPQSQRAVGAQKAGTFNWMGSVTVKGDHGCWEELFGVLCAQAFLKCPSASASLSRAWGEQLVSILNMLKICLSPLLVFISSTCKRIVFSSEGKPPFSCLSVFWCTYCRFIV